MRFTYVASDNTAGNAQTLGADADQDILVKALIIGTPADGKKVKFYNKLTAYGSASGIGSTDSNSVAAIITVPTAAAGKVYQQYFAFATAENPGLQLNGGAFHTDATDVTVLWEPVVQDEA